MDSETTQVQNNAISQPVANDVNENTIRQYFKFLCEDEQEIFTVAFLFDGLSGGHTKGNVPGFGIYHGKVNDILKVLVKLREQYGQDVSLHVTLNRTNLLGRKSGHIESARVLCVDLDGVEQEKLDEALTCFPGLIVQSSEDGAGKFHVYWRFEGDLDLWKCLQLSLAYRFGGDLNLDQITKTIRVPGVARITKSGASFTPTMLLRGSETICAENVPARFPWAKESFEAAKEARKLVRRAQAKLIAEALAGKRPQGLQALRASGRNNFLYWAVKKFIGRFMPGEAMMGLGAATEFGQEVNSGFSEALGSGELESTVRSAYSHGVGLWEFRRGKYQEKLGNMDKEVVIEEEKGCQNGIGQGHMNGEIKEPQELEEVGLEYNFKDQWLAGNSFSDYGLMARVLQHFGADIVKCGEDLLAFNNKLKCWKVQRKVSSEIDSMIGVIIADLRKDKRFCLTYCMGEDDMGKKKFSPVMLEKALLRFETSKKTADVRTRIEKSPRIKEMARREFDAAPDLLYVKNGLLDLVTGNLREPLAGDFLWCQSQVEYRPADQCKGWLKFLGEIFDKDTELIEFVREVFGYSLQGRIDEQVLFCHYGNGANGKSKLLSALGLLMGDYFSILDPNDISFNEKTNARPFERVAVRLEGKRVVVLDDLEVSEKWSEATVKNLTSPICRARGEHEKSREIVNRAKVHLGLNVAPKPQAENHGLLRRLCFIPYNRRFNTGTDKSIEIDKMIQSEISGILNWAITGFKRWKVRGKLELPVACIEAIEEYKHDNFQMETLILEMWEKGDETCEQEFIATEDLLQEFSAKLGGGKPISKVVLARNIRATLDAKEDRKRACGTQKRGFYLKRKYSRGDVLMNKTA